VEEFCAVSAASPKASSNCLMENSSRRWKLTCVELELKARACEEFRDRMLTIGRSAVLTVSTRDAPRAIIAASAIRRVVSPVPISAALVRHSPAAQKTGRLTMRPYSVVHKLDVR